MLKNYLKIAFRNIYKQKTYSLINILGLALGIACTILIFQWVQNELSYDRFHKNADNLYIATFSNGSATTPTALSEYLKSEYPEIKYTSRCSYSETFMMKYSEIKANQDGGVLVDNDFIKMFSIPFIQGNSEIALNDPHSIIISERIARKYFGNEAPIGKIIELDGKYDLKITGVMKNYPLNSYFNFEYLIPLTLSKEWDNNLATWNLNNIQTFVQLQNEVPPEKVDKKIATVVEKHRALDKRSLFLRPITELHLYDFPREGGFITYVYLFAAMAGFILLIACINFINLTTARSANRALEVGIRKTSGATKSDLVKQFFSESVVLTIISMLLGLLMVFLFLPVFNSLTNKQFTFDLLNNVNMIWVVIGITIITGVIAGSYPALYLSHFQPVKVLKGAVRAGAKDSVFRKVLVVSQFSISIFLIIGSLVILSQINFMKNKELGIDKDNIIHFRIGNRFENNHEVIKKEMLKNSNIPNITLTNCAPYYWDSNAGLGSVTWEGQTNQQTSMVETAVDYDYLETFKLKLSEGRFFSKEYGTDITEAYVVNRAAIIAMGMDSPIGKELQISGRKGKIIGVLEDYNYESLHMPILPMAMQIRPDKYSTACVRINNYNISETLAFIEKKYMEIYPDKTFDYNFLDDSIKKQYTAEIGIGRIFNYFTFLAIFISCLGLFGLASFTAEQRRKEIGIRKVLGASDSGILLLLSKEFAKWVLVANLIAWPVAFYFMNKWLQGFAYRIEISLWVFVFSCAIALSIALATVSYQAIKAALANPIDSLKYE